MKTKIKVEKARNGFILSNEDLNVKIIATTEKLAADSISESLSHTLIDMKDGDKILIEFQVTKL